MTVIELAKLLGRHIAQGHGDYEVSVFQWEHGQEKLDAVEIRTGGQLEFYSGIARPEPEPQPFGDGFFMDDLI